MGQLSAAEIVTAARAAIAAGDEGEALDALAGLDAPEPNEPERAGSNAS